ncbi:hypothetical protein KIMCHI1738_61 [Corynebacterium phage Kimchi1738]|uniref:Uncharacterized protein n=1 Tax=Corynebacterium phage Kimchi1738 TaxID=2483719 RepID=A0A3G3LWJ0_9CAUD|nr:hypothetical protein KNU16_gp83 [Corynebacterium phage Kimchi1738]AYQ98448.1 hypothetical protein KIMCHI1738_61 [Corynebacterium phage Kimchi1738]
MSDIIKEAQRLLEGATPGPWEWVGHSIESEDDMVLDFQCVTEFGMDGASKEVEVTPEDEALIAAAPELAHALAEEEYQYGVTYTGVNRGGHHIEWVEPTGDTELDQETLQIIVKNWEIWGQSPKVVRRRVSPPEVINV